MNAIVVGQRGALRDGLIALLYTIPDIRVVSATEDYCSARELLADESFSFVLLQVDSPGQACADWVQSVKGRAPNAKILALVNEASLTSACSDAGVDRALIQGTDTGRLREIIEELVDSP